MSKAVFYAFGAMGLMAMAAIVSLAVSALLGEHAGPFFRIAIALGAGEAIAGFTMLAIMLYGAWRER